MIIYPQKKISVSIRLVVVEILQAFQIIQMCLGFLSVRGLPVELEIRDNA